MSALRTLLSLPIAFLLGDCLYYSSPMSNASDGTAQMREIDTAVASTTLQQAQAFLSGQTWRSAEGSSGQHIHYSTPDGRDLPGCPGRA